MTALFAYPMRLTANGDIATVEDGTVEAHAQELTVAALTRRGERELAPTFGVDDPTFRGFDAEALALHVEIFGPPVEIVSAEIRYLDATHQDVVIHFE